MAADVYTFTVPDAVTVAGPAGITTGWGYCITTASLWLVTTDLSAGTFQHATPDLLFDFPGLAPSATLMLSYNPSTAAGLYQIVRDADAPQGFVNSGTFTLTAEWWNGDPVAGGSFVGTAPIASQSYAASVTPEPPSIALIASPFLLFGAIGVPRRAIYYVECYTTARPFFPFFIGGKNPEDL
jgi:hypothetical protein